MIAIDFDGTLLNPQGIVTPRTKAAVHRAVADGFRVCFATGRNWTESQGVLESVAHYDTAVFVGGAMVVDTRQRVTVQRTLMDQILAADVCGFLEALGHTALALQDTHSAGGVDYLASDGRPLNVETSGWMQAMRARLMRVPDLAAHRHEHTIRVGIVAEAKKTAEAIAALNDHFAERIMVHSIQVPGCDVEVMEIFDPAVNKWQGLLQVAQRHGIDPDEIIAIGDEINDIPMIRNAGLGVAMGNARAAVRGAAKKVIGSNADDGLAEFLEELVSERLMKPVGA